MEILQPRVDFGDRLGEKGGDTRTMTRFGRSALLAAMLALAGCASGESGFSPLAEESGKGAIYVYTLDDDFLEQSPAIALDGREVGRLEPRGHRKFRVEPGRHSVSVTAALLLVIPVKGKAVEVDVPAGEGVFLRVDSFRGYTVTQMPADIARDEIATTRTSSTDS